ncbi:hypothetical protein C8A00DRAFT_47004 [Chaetomidium leptoderma]|uniref:C2H2-type domain-containing protein n=1 Tax=Chaetomidium leptoderma TaxID=669021 RepID=A0AAN6ZUG7_9PEZI|nr:hypothetical protein C8A00DRAFT_47004 [Chaetomidium leptoderma]
MAATWHCNLCDRSFGSQEALEQHQGDSPAHTKRASQFQRSQPPLQPPTSTPYPAHRSGHHHAHHASADALPPPGQPPTIPPPLTCRGNTYTTLTPSEQATLYARLLNHCHTTARLKRERYPLPPTATTPFPPPNHYPSSRPKYKAVVLDCEMVGVRQGTEQVVTLSLIDFFTGATLINTVVEPDPARYTVTDWRSAITGVSAARMASAVAQGRALGGKEGAVARLFEYVDSQTVLVGQAVKGDLKALGLGHGRIVDSALLTAEASGMAGRGVGLERLCRELTGCHDSLEDVLAAREVVIWCLQHPVELREWARKNWKVAPTTARGGSGSNNKARRGGGGGRGGGSGYAARSTRSYAWESDDDSDDDREVLRWEDVVDWDTWLKSPPDWSD